MTGSDAIGLMLVAFGVGGWTGAWLASSGGKWLRLPCTHHKQLTTNPPRCALCGKVLR